MGYTVGIDVTRIEQNNYCIEKANYKLALRPLSKRLDS